MMGERATGAGAVQREGQEHINEPEFRAMGLRKKLEAD
jgi:hypothetical protein